MKRTIALTIFLLLGARTANEMPQPILPFFVAIKPVEEVKKVSITTTSMDVLHPVFRQLIQQLIDSCSRACIDLKVLETYRTHAHQNYLFKFKKGATTLKGGKSKHQHGLAVDIVPVNGNQFIWNDAKLWLKIGKIGEHYGLRWGGRWKNPYDPSHFEMWFSTAKKYTTPILEEELILVRGYWNVLEKKKTNL